MLLLILCSPCWALSGGGGGGGGGGAPTGAAGGGLTGSYPNPTVATVPATALPNPSATTLGGVQSKTAVGSQWLNTISTSGVPGSTQPAFTDISGSVAAGQMPALTGNCVTSAGAVSTSCFYDIAFNPSGTLIASQQSATTLVRAVNWAANFVGSAATCGTNPTGTAAFTIKDGGTQIGTLSLSTSCVATFTTTSGTSKSGAAGDRIILTAPASPDASLADLAVTLQGTS